MVEQVKTDLVVIGSGPGGMACAYRAADLGMKVTMVEQSDALGGICLNVGCIPSKALLHTAQCINDMKKLADKGVVVDQPKIDASKLHQWVKDEVIHRLNKGVEFLAKKRQVQVVRGHATFLDNKTLKVAGDKQEYQVLFDKAVIAVGSRPVTLDSLPRDERIFDSTGALELNRISGRMLVLGGGIIGCEMANVYQALGVEVTICEMMDTIMLGVDKDCVKACRQIFTSRGIRILEATKVSQVKASKKGLSVVLESKKGKETEEFDQIMVSIGRRPNGDLIGAEHAGIVLSEKGAVQVNQQLQTSQPHIYAIGDVTGKNLAHEATAMGHVCAEIMVGKRKSYAQPVIPSVAYTDPEVAWAGVTEAQAKEANIPYKVAFFPWQASGRSLSQGRSEGLTKLLVHSQHQTIIGAAIVGPHAGELIGECVLAMEMGCDIEDLALTVHPHPTFSESIALAAENYLGTITDL